MRGGRRALAWALPTSAGEELVYHNGVRMLLLLLLLSLEGVVSRRVSCWIVDWPSRVWPVTMRRRAGSAWVVALVLLLLLLSVVVDEGRSGIVAAALGGTKRG
jgi:putative copper export protein